MLRAGRLEVPAKMTSSISLPRMRLAEVSPITQRSASTRFDLPQPLGPTMPVMPGSIRNSVASTNDLNPATRSLANCIDRSSAAAHHRPQQLVEIGELGRAVVALAVYDQRGHAAALGHILRLGAEPPP